MIKKTLPPLTDKNNNKWKRLPGHFSALILIVLLFILLCFHHFLHHHKADGDIHKDCLICIFLHITVFHFGIGHFIFFLLYPLLLEIFQLPPKPILEIYGQIFPIRAPPFDYLYPYTYTNHRFDNYTHLIHLFYRR